MSTANEPTIISMYLGPELNNAGETQYRFLGKPDGATRNSIFSVSRIRLRHNFYIAFNKLYTEMSDFLDSSIPHKTPTNEGIVSSYC